MYRSSRYLILGSVLFSCLLSQALPINSTSIRCETLVKSIQAAQLTSAKKAEPRKLTLIEQQFAGRTPPLAAEDQLSQEVAQLRSTNPDLAQKVKDAIQAKARGHSLKLDLSGLPVHMILFLEGPFAKVVGLRGLSKPFMTIRLHDEKTLYIHHEGDQFPLLVRWSDGLAKIEDPTSYIEDGKTFQLLAIPSQIRSKESLNGISKKYIFGLISGSALNRYIPSRSSTAMTIASLLHDGRLIFDRPTQIESKQVQDLLNSNIPLRTKVRSLLFVAPTATGKTRVLGDAIINKIKNFNTSKQNPDVVSGSKKLIVLMTKTPDLTSNLAKEIGEQLFAEVGSRNCRIVQWGGELTENMALPDLLNFSDNSEVPVVLVTSYPTLAARAKSSSDKSQIFKRAIALLIDEAHNVGGETFDQVFKAALDVANSDRNSGNVLNSLSILGVTASPITREQRTVELYDASFWAAVESPGLWAERIVKNPSQGKVSNNVLEWIRITQQYSRARERGEINASEPLFYKPEERGFKFSSIFKRGETGTQSSVNLEKLKEIWPDIAKMVEGHGPGVIHTYPRDAEAVANLLSGLSGRNFISLQKMNVTERSEVYSAFKNRTLYQGKTVDAIVGTIREGLDFPQAGWYLSFKKYVKFPENIQGPGRVVRLALNKLTPKIIFFGEDIDKVTYSDVKELILSRLGRLPVKLPEGRLYSGARKLPESSRLGQAAENLNVALEALFRIRQDLTRQLGEKDELKPEIIKEFQDLLLDIKASNQNREISNALRKFILEVNAYPFFTGDLHSTWRYCDRILALQKKLEAGESKAGIKPQDSEVLMNPALLEKIREFRGLYAALGLVPRAIIERLELRPSNVSEIANATNLFVESNGVLPYSLNDSPSSLQFLMKDVMRTSPETFWRHLNLNSRSIAAPVFEARSKISFETILKEFYQRHHTFPKLDIESIGSHESPGVEIISEKLADELVDRLKAGDLDLSALPQDLIQELDQSELYARLMFKLLQSFRNLEKELQQSIGDSYIHRLAQDQLLTYENLMKSGDFRILQIVKALDSKLGPTSQSNQYRRMFEEVLKAYNP